MKDRLPIWEPLSFEVDDPRAPKPAKLQASSDERVWSENKADLVAEYLRLFLMVTKHGIYIDGFAGPQHQEGRENLWTARHVLEIQPAWMRAFHLCDLGANQLRALRELAATHSDREVWIYGGDFNEVVNRILTPEFIGPKDATFCLLDQRTFECDWATVQRIAQHPKARFKIEIFYFLHEGWFGRSFSASKVDGQRRIAAWWGRRDWRMLNEISGRERASLICERFEQELDYGYAYPFAIFHKGGREGRVMYYMIHASDHPDAPVLMQRAYAAAVKVKDPDQLTLT